MSLHAGERLGPYEILTLIGVGGMGEVYRARDTRLGREVALKVSAAEFTERFEREARAVAALNHPNICTLHDVGANYLVMELVEGESPKGPLPLEKALGYARQIANALEAAHEKGIVHRDLKPGNIKIKPDGTVKVLDFGLAKVTQAEARAMSDDSPTQSFAATQAGTLLGTAAYMAPEQARGEEVDRRADIWALGVVLYEMLTGSRTFEGKTISDTLAAVLVKEPALDRVPVQVRPVLQRCLAKEPKQRLHHAADVRLLLEESGQESPPAVLAGVSRSRLGIVALAVAAVSLSAFALLAVVHFSERLPEADMKRFEVAVPTPRVNPILSPDGKWMAFNRRGDGGANQLWLHSFESNESKPLAGTEGITQNPFWSPDSRLLAYATEEGKLRRVNVGGGLPTFIADLGGAWRGGTWGRDANGKGTIVFAASPPDGGSQLHSVAEAGGEVSPLTRAEPPREILDSHPWFLPDGRHFLYHRNTRDPASSGIYVGSLDAATAQSSQFLVASGSEPFVSYAPSPDLRGGYLLFQRDGSLMAQPFDPETQQLKGEAVPVVDGLGSGAIGARPFSLSTNGVLAYRTDVRASAGSRQLTWFDREGKPQGTVGEPGEVGTVSLSPDGTRVAVDRRDPGVARDARGARGTGNLLVYDLVRNLPMQITFSSEMNAAPIWSPNSDRIVFSSGRDDLTTDLSRGRVGLLNLYHRPSSGAGVDEPLLKSNEPKYPQAWSPDGRFLLYSNGRNREIWKLPLDTKSVGSIVVNGKEEPYIIAAGSEQAQFSPDGSFVVYSRLSDGPPDVYVQAFPDPSKGNWKVSEAGGRQPRWRGKEIFYLSLDFKMMAVEVNTSPVFQVLARKTLFPVPIEALGGPANTYRYDVTADGKKFLINSEISGKPAPNGGPPPITVILNWQSLLSP